MNIENKEIIVNLLTKLGVEIRINKSAKGGFRRDDVMGSTFSPSKIFIMNGKRASLGQARCKLAKFGLFYKKTKMMETTFGTFYKKDKNDNDIKIQKGYYNEADILIMPTR